MSDFWLGALFAAALGLLGWRLRAIDFAGCVTGIALSLGAMYGVGVRGFALVAAFVIAGSAATRFGYDAKARRGIAQSRQGQRGAIHALTKLGVASVCAVISRVVHSPEAWQAAFVAAIAAALADTLGTEVGQVMGAHPVHIAHRRTVVPGTPGGVSWQGMIAGVGGACIIGASALLFGLMPVRLMLPLVFVVFVAVLIESLLGEMSTRFPVLNNPFRNGIVTAFGALLMALVAGR